MPALVAYPLSFVWTWLYWYFVHSRRRAHRPDTSGASTSRPYSPSSERGRYIVRPDALGDPSSTSVNHEGAVAVAIRNGGITKLYALPERWADTNGAPGIQTATDEQFLP
jgi:hypothetical protein